jgi:hypothetical protein
MIGAQYKYTAGLAILEYAIPWVMIVLGAEILLNTILDIYRPRVAGQYAQAAFDSRLLGLVNEPAACFIRWPMPLIISLDFRSRRHGFISCWNGRFCR